MAGLFPPNAILTFEIATGGYTVDPATNNPVPIRSPLIVQASLAQKSNSTLQEIEGLDPSRIYMAGKALNPKFLPDPVVGESRAILFLLNFATGQIISGDFYLLPVVESRYKAVTKALGSSIHGYFIQAGVTQTDLSTKTNFYAGVL